MYKPSRPLLAAGSLVFLTTYASLWFVENQPWLLLVPVIGGCALWGMILWDFANQRVPFLKAMQDTSKYFGRIDRKWRLVLVAASAAYGVLVGLKGN
jgi:hypothetical protein